MQLETGVRPSGPIRLLTHLRYFGYCFNPVSFYYCYGESHDRVEAIVAEVNNTPWGERHCYVLQNEGSTDRRHFRSARRKEFHVSPFMPMDMDYAWHFRLPGERLAVHMQNVRDGVRVFDATLTLKRYPISPGTLASTLARFPFLTVAVIARIYWQAFRLWLKGTPVYPHPNKVTPTTTDGAKAS